MNEMIYDTNSAGGEQLILWGVLRLGLLLLIPSRNERASERIVK